MVIFPLLDYIWEEAMKKILFMLCMVLILAGCTQAELYDEYNKKWNLDLPRPVQVFSGLIKSLDPTPAYSETFDLYLVYQDVENFSEKTFWVELSDEERHQLISDLSDVHKLDRNTVEARRQELEKLLEIDLGSNCKALLKQQSQHGVTEKIILLQSKDQAKLYLLHLSK